MDRPWGFIRVQRCLGLSVAGFLVLFSYGWGCSWGWAQQVELLTKGEYRPGEYIPLRIETDGPGRVSIRADQSLGIDWDAPGKTSVIIPWMTWTQSGGELVLKINGRSQRLELRRLEENQDYSTNNPYEVLVKFPGPKRSGYLHQVYEPIIGWRGGVGSEIRWNLVWIGVIFILILFSIRLVIETWMIRPWILLAVGLIGLAIVGGVSAMNQPLARAIAVIPIPSSAPESDVWVYLRAWRQVRVSEPWSAYTLLFPRSVSHLRALDPVIRIREDGLTGRIELSLAPHDTVCLLYRRQVGVFSGTDEYLLHPQSLKQWFYVSPKQ